MKSAGRRKKALELYKGAVLILLILCAGWLTYQNWFYDSGLLESAAFGWIGGDGGADGAVQEQNSFSAAAQPLRVLIRSDGQAVGAQYDAVQLGGLYDSVSRYFGEALGSAGSPEEVTAQQWSAGLTGNCVFIEYDGAVPLRALAAWLGTEVSAPLRDGAADRLFLAQNGENTLLYYRDEQGPYYRCSCAIMYENIAGQTAQLSGQSCFFVLEDERYGGIDPDTVITNAEPTPKLLLSYTAADSDDKLGVLLSSFDINPYTESRYEESDGTWVIVQRARAFRLEPGGAAVYMDSDPGSTEESLYAGGCAEEVIESVRQILAPIETAVLREASFALSAYSYDAASDTYSIAFGYRVDGIPVRLSQGEAASFTIKNGYITEIRLNLRAYKLGEELSYVFPQRQAAAALSPSGDDLEMILCYVDDGADSIGAVWRGQ